MAYDYQNGYDNKVEIKEYGYLPTCRFCGQTKLPAANYESQAQADEAATITCDCPDAKMYQIKVDRKKKREENITKLKSSLGDIQDYCDKRSVDMNDKLYDYMLKMGIAILDGVIDSCQLKFARMKVSASLNNKANLVIKFTYSDGAAIEV